MVVHGYMSQRLVAHAQMSAHKFPTAAEEIKWLIYNFPPTFSQYRLYYDLKVRTQRQQPTATRPRTDSTRAALRMAAAGERLAVRARDHAN